MSTLAEIEAADPISPQEKATLLRFLAMHLKKKRLPPTNLLKEELAAMRAEDEGGRRAPKAGALRAFRQIA